MLCDHCPLTSLPIGILGSSTLIDKRQTRFHCAGRWRDGGGASARWQRFESINSSSNALVKPLVDFTMVGYVRMQPQGSLARVLVHTSPMVNSSVQREGHTLDFVAKSTKSSAFGAKSTKSRFEVATLHRNVDHRGCLQTRCPRVPRLGSHRISPGAWHCGRVETASETQGSDGGRENRG